jgi:hypothetical protein
MKKEDDLEYYLATKDELGDIVIYNSDIFKLSEIDIINLIKICLIEARSKAIGKRILEVYRDSTSHRKHITQTRLNLIGIKEDGERKPTKPKKTQLK